MRRVGVAPRAGFFKPAGIPLSELEVSTLTLDEVETLRLADRDGLYQEQAAEQMGISRPTFARIVEEARRKVADALVHGKALRLEGGAVIMKGETEMPKGDGAGPAGRARGMGRGPCGRGHGWAGGRNAETVRREMRPGTTLVDASAENENNKNDGGKERPQS